MRLAAVYIPSNSIPYLFGKNHLAQVINLGGQYNYKFETKLKTINILSRETNNDFIHGFWGENISLVSAIVGRNGIGKTTLLRALNHVADRKNVKCLYVYEYNDEIKLINETDLEISFNFKVNSEIISSRGIEKQYYSPVLDYDLKDSSSSIALIRYADTTIDNYFLDSIRRNILLLRESVMEAILEIYPDFPNYDKYYISVKQYNKSHFLNLYATANFANFNRGDAVRNHIDGDITKLERDTSEKEMSIGKVINMLKDYRGVIDSASFSSLFRKLWDLEEYNVVNDYQYIHNQDNFIKNLEVTLLSYLLLGAVFADNGLRGESDFNEVLKEKTFYLKLDAFLDLYLTQIYGFLSEKIIKDYGGIKVSNSEAIIEIIKKDSKWTKIRGVKMESVRKKMLQVIDTFVNVKDFYDFLKEQEKKGILKIENGSLVFDILDNDISVFNKIVDLYKGVLKGFDNIPVFISILDFTPNKKLSSGEKSLIDFYSSLNKYIDDYKSRNHQMYENYLLLLDEPELGYHPLWKKKFVQAIVKTLPVLFSKITPHKYDEERKETVKSRQSQPNLQIIFSTHDPLTLSDLPNSNVVYLNKLEINEPTTILNKETQPQKSFGANITDLLADSFFIENGLVGDFAKSRIQEVMDNLNYLILGNEIEVLKTRKRENEKDLLETKIAEKKKLESRLKNLQEVDIRSIIDIIDEPILKFKLDEMYYQAFPQKIDKEDAITRAKQILGNAGLSLSDLNEGESS